MRLRLLFLVILTGLMVSSLSAQRIVGLDTLYGNEWLEAGKQYVKVMLAEDGLYSFRGFDLRSAGMDLNGKTRQDLTVYSFGEKIALHIDGPPTGSITDTDRFIFVGERNRNQFDAWLYDDENVETLHPDASLITDSVAYYITFESSSNPRFTSLPAPTGTRSAKSSFKTESILTWKEGHQPAPINRYVALSNFSPAEGYTNGLRSSSLISQSLPQGVPGASVDVEINFIGSGGIAHSYELALNNELLEAGSFFGATLNQFSSNDATILPSNRILRFSLVSSGSSDRLAFGQISSKYERTGEFRNERSTIIHKSALDTSTYVFWNLGVAIDSLFALSMVQNVHYEHFNSGDSIFIKFDNFNSDKILVGVPHNISSFKLFEPNMIIIGEDTDGLVLTSKLLEQTSGPRSIFQDYTSYRSSTVGGGRNVVVLYVEDLYDEFGFGIPRHPQALRNAIHYYRTQSSLLNYLLIIGKGRSYNQLRTPSQISSSQNFSAFVPSFGSPASDVMLSTFPGSNKPTLFSARIPAESLEEVAIFLEKIRTVESGLVSPTEEDIKWRRNYIHLSGGDEPQQQQRIKSVMSSLGNQLSDSELSGEVFSFFRQSSSPVESSQLDKVFSTINEGVSLINFYGHGSVSILGFNIDFPDRFSNQETTPPFLIFGCSAGNVHLPGKGVVERLFNLENKGVSFAGANSTLSFESDINQFLPVLYEKWGRPWDYGGTVGSVIGESFNEFLDSSPGSQKVAFIQQYQLVGDPMHQLYLPNTSDLTWDEERVFISPKILVPTDQTITISADMLNLGRKADSVEVILTREFQDGTSERYVKNIQNIVHRNSLVWELPANSDVAGVQRFSLQIDSLNVLEERLTSNSEQNNTFSGSNLEALVLSNAAEVIYPSDKALLDCPTALLGITSNPFAELRTYKIELALEPTFTNLLDTKTIEQKGGVLQWEPSILQAGQTYFWRVAPIQGDSILAGYQMNSFTCTTNGEKAGFVLKAPNQFTSNVSSSSLSKNISGWTFPDNTKEFYIRNQLRTAAEYPIILENGAFREANYGNDIRSGIYVFVVDPTNLEALTNPIGGLYGTETPANWRDREVFGFLTSDSIQRREVVAFLDSIVPPGHYVSFLTIFDETNSYEAEEWEADEIYFERSIFSVLEEQGATSVRNLSDGASRPYIFSYRKDQGAIDERLAVVPDEIISMSLAFTGSWFTGEYISEPFALSDSIDAIQVLVDDQRNLEDLDFWLSVYSTDENGIADTIASGNTVRLQLSDVVGPSESKRLSIAWSCTDTASRVPLNVTSIILNARAKPDIVYDMRVNEFSDKLEASYNDTLKLGTTIFNASPHVVDSIQLSFSADQSVVVSSTLDTGFTLLNLGPFEGRFVPLWSINRSPTKVSTVVRSQITSVDGLSFDQDTSNNLVFRTILLENDLTEPLLKISVNGELLIDGSLISSSPEIEIIAIDDNEFIGEGIVNWKVLHTQPDGSTEELIVGSAELRVTGKNELQKYLIWSPAILSDGVHEIEVSILNEAGSDQRANLRRTFEVVNKQTISDFLPYPNPAVDNVRFAYELTGNSILTDYQIDIYTTSGRVVTSLGPSQLGALKPGRNLTDLSWDGTTQFGQKLARGTYLYRFSARGEDNKGVEARATGISDYVKSGFGKLVLLR